MPRSPLGNQHVCWVSFPLPKWASDQVCLFILHGTRTQHRRASPKRQPPDSDPRYWRDPYLDWWMILLRTIAIRLFLGTRKGHGQLWWPSREKLFKAMVHTSHTCGSVEAYSWGSLLDHSSVNKTSLGKKTSVKSHPPEMDQVQQGRLNLCQALAAVRYQPANFEVKGSRYREWLLSRWQSSIVKSFMPSRRRYVLSNWCFKNRRYLELQVMSHERPELGAEGV